MKRRALFLDRDGVINVDTGYVHCQEAFQFIDGIFDLVRHAVASGLLVIVVTNQAGIGRGYYTERQFHDLMAWVAEQFAVRGGHLDGVYFCPFHPEHGVGKYQQESDWRKPAPGMILAAAADFDIDLAASLMIGDTDADVEAARRAGIGTRLLLIATNRHSYAARTIASLSEAIPFIAASR
jgi:D-glycero-D-manno-heptose 1,7-bisphosphate phosphatase